MFSLLWVFSPTFAKAQVASGVDLQALGLPLSSSPASMIESTEQREAGFSSWTLRTSGLSHPLSLRYPTPAPEGATANIVSGVVISELATIVGLGRGFDVAFGFGAHLYQSSPAPSPTEEGIVTRFKVRDPRIGVGHASKLGSLHIRPFAQVYLPVGDTEAFASESSVRAKFGSSIGLTTSHIQFCSEISFIARQQVQISAATWGPQLVLGTGASALISQNVAARAEVVLQPVLSRQTSLSGQPGGYFVPAEALSSLAYSWRRFNWGLGAGLGLPFSRNSTANPERKFVRGPTTPTYRAFLDMTVAID